MTDCGPQHRGKPKVDLILNQAGLIILFNSGVIYQNQTCNTACAQRCEEGILVLPTDPELVVGAPVEVYLCPIMAALHQMGWGPIQGISTNVADEIDDLLTGYGWTKGISVDRLRLDESEEAWVYVNVEPADIVNYSGFGSCKGVLVWQNSD